MNVYQGRRSVRGGIDMMDRGGGQGRLYNLFVVPPDSRASSRVCCLFICEFAKGATLFSSILLQFAS